MVLFQVKAAGLVQVFDLLTTPTFYRVIPLFRIWRMIRDVISNKYQSSFSLIGVPFH